MSFVKRRGTGGGRIKAWSFSRWNTWRGCPKKAFFKFVERLEEKQGRGAFRGQRMHEAIEAYLKRTGKLPSVELTGKHFRGDIQRLRRQKAISEGELAFTQEWSPTGWFDHDAWVRIKADARLPVVKGVAQSIDFKSGKMREEEHRLQAELQCVGELLAEPEATVARGSVWYLDSGDEGEEEVTREELPRVLKAWEERVKPMLADRTFPERPGSHCGWCSFRKADGGPCKF